ncbi:MAG: DUF192 domain-containing protein, partial [Treponema sp.]|nr:DUF192 domain-containing protein [Treponema sp.]
MNFSGFFQTRAYPKKQPGIGLVCCLWVVLTGVNCVARGSALETRELTIETTQGTWIPITAEIARTDQERSQGLMNRKSLADGKGMLFVFEKDQILSFWMKNTLIPLSIAFISSEGKILEIHDMAPGDMNTLHSSRSARYALETPQSWF